MKVIIVWVSHTIKYEGYNNKMPKEAFPEGFKKCSNALTSVVAAS